MSLEVIRRLTQAKTSEATAHPPEPGQAHQVPPHRRRPRRRLRVAGAGVVAPEGRIVDKAGRHGYILMTIQK